MELLTKPGFDFCFDPRACETCNSRCCRGEPGNIWASHQEVQAICDLLKINLIDGIERYFKRVGNRFSIREIDLGNDCPCVFLSPEKGCSIYGARPSQCQTFPFWTYFKIRVNELCDECPGVTRLP